MDIAAATATAVKTPEAETEAPTRNPPTIKSLSFSNGVLKRHQPLNHHHHHHNATAPAVVTYKECLKNHAASLGSHAVDGCGEFMPSPTATSTDPTSLKCAACGCHRNFHRRDPEEPSLPPPNTTAALEYKPHHRHHPPPPLPAHHISGGHSSPSSPSPPPISSSYYPSAPHMLLALSSGLPVPPQDNNISNNLPVVTTTPSTGNTNSNGRKRFRTKFTQDQKDKMLEFADRVGWKIQKRDEELIANLCNEIGVDKGVLKVWMHNNKNLSGKRDQSNPTTTSTAVDGGTAANNGNGISDNYGIHYHHQNHEINNDKKNNIQDQQNDHFGPNNNNISDSIPVATNGNGSSSSS